MVRNVYKIHIFLWENLYKESVQFTHSEYLKNQTPNSGFTIQKETNTVWPDKQNFYFHKLEQIF